MSVKTLKSVYKFAAIAALAAGVAAVPAVSPLIAQGVAQTSNGITVFGGLEPNYRLGYSIDRNEPFSNDARYYLEVNADKLPRQVIEIEVSYPKEFNELRGEINPENIELRYGTYRGEQNNTIPLDDIVVSDDGENIVLEIYPTEPIAAESSFVIVMENVHNPRRFGIHYFNLKLLYQGDVLRQYAGTWDLEVASE